MTEELMSYAIERIPPIHSLLLLVQTDDMKKFCQPYLELAIDCI
jgi:hypothetical protein